VRETSGDMFTLFGATTGTLTDTFVKDGWTGTSTGSSCGRMPPRTCTGCGAG
jgi:hypothetical protein